MSPCCEHHVNSGDKLTSPRRDATTQTKWFLCQWSSNTLALPHVVASVLLPPDMGVLDDLVSGFHLAPFVSPGGLWMSGGSDFSPTLL